MSNINAKIINDIIQTRKSVYPKNYINKEIPTELIEQVLENANRAPTHKQTEPWRFKVIRGNKRKELGEFLSEKYKEIVSTDTFSELKQNKFLINPTLANCIIIINMQRDASNKIPEWEEIASVAMAVQNMYLTCTAYNIGCYWSSPKQIEFISEFIEMAQGEKCLGLFYMGYYDKELPIIKRTSIQKKVKWL